MLLNELISSISDLLCEFLLSCTKSVFRKIHEMNIFSALGDFITRTARSSLTVIQRDNLLKKIIPEKTKRIHSRDDANYTRD